MISFFTQENLGEKLQHCQAILLAFLNKKGFVNAFLFIIFSLHSKSEK